MPTTIAISIAVDNATNAVEDHDAGTTNLELLDNENFLLLTGDYLLLLSN